jgi:hypothetical protein
VVEKVLTYYRDISVGAAPVDEPVIAAPGAGKRLVILTCMCISKTSTADRRYYVHEAGASGDSYKRAGHLVMHYLARQARLIPQGQKFSITENTGFNVYMIHVGKVIIFGQYRIEDLE